MELPAGIPSDAHALMTRLLAEDPRPADWLRQQLRTHLATVRDAAEINPHLEPRLALRLVQVCEALLDEAASQGTEEARRLVQAAVRYFIEDDDGEHDLTSVVGLIDDAEICNAVARALGRGDLVTDT